MYKFPMGTVIPISFLTGRESGGDPFQVLLSALSGLKDGFSLEQKEAFEYLQGEYKKIQDDLEEVANLLYESEVYELMQPFAPANCLWGSHPEGCLGFWPDDWED